MKLLRVGEFRKEKPAVMMPDGRVVDVSSKVRDYDSAFFEDGGVEKLRAIVKGDLPSIDLGGKRLGSPVARPYKVLGVGLNYADHAKESGMPIPPEPVMFTKATNTVVGPNDTVLIPRASKKTDWEVELGVVIGKTARYIPSKDVALSYVAGYCISNDVSDADSAGEGRDVDKASPARRSIRWGRGSSPPTRSPDPQTLGRRST
jgi:2-keto-4-pentenoate hydratase/2-oxohepta-3-ene-1,7-dioic acid hydratase in catechol pathway